jgi:hypothetical protein
MKTVENTGKRTLSHHTTRLLLLNLLNRINGQTIPPRPSSLRLKIQLSLPWVAVCEI